MTIQRSPRRHNYVLIDQRIFEDERLDHKLLGILLYLLSKPDNWKTNSRQLAKRFGCSKDTTCKLLRQLESLGYLTREQTQNPDTGLIEWITIVHEEPLSEKLATVSEKTVSGKTGSGKVGLITNTERTITELKDHHDEGGEAKKSDDPFYRASAKAIAREVTKQQRQMVGVRNFVTDGPWGRLALELNKDALQVWKQFEQYMFAVHNDKRDTEAYVAKVASGLYQNPGTELACPSWLKFEAQMRRNGSAPPPPRRKTPAKPPEPLPDRQESMEAVKTHREAILKALGKQSDE